MATVRKVNTKIIKETPAEMPVEETVEAVESEVSDNKGGQIKSAPTKRGCLFCESKTEPAYWDIATLRRFMNDRGRISLRARTGACGKHQRRVAREIKHARHLAMLPFMVRV